MAIKLHYVIFSNKYDSSVYMFNIVGWSFFEISFSQGTIFRRFFYIGAGSHCVWDTGVSRGSSTWYTLDTQTILELNRKRVFTSIASI